VDTGFSQRVRALACTAPLHDLDARKSAVQTHDFTPYQMSELALHAIDLVTLAMDFDAGASPETVTADLARYAATHAPERGSDEHNRVAQWVLEHVLNVGSADRGFRAVYGVTTEDGSYRRHDFDFKLLEEVPGADGDIFLRATNEAVNVLVGALDIDVEDAQIAADLRLESLIRKGRLSDAQAAAQTARYRTIQYGEQLRRRLEATTRDVRSVDWLEEMPTFLNEALDHIEARFKAENAILVNITAVRDTADDPARKAQAASLVGIVKDCLRRHEQLEAALQGAGTRFRAEQDRQSFAPVSPRASLDLHGQLLVPALALPVQDAEGVLGAYFTGSTGLTVPVALRLVDLFAMLIRPPAERDVLGGEVQEPDLSDEPELPAFPDECYDHLEELLDLDPEAPRRLSGLLEEARSRHPELALLVVIRVLALAAEEIGSARRRGAPGVLIAVDDGTALEDPEFAGADLIVARAALNAATAESTVPSPASSPETSPTPGTPTQTLGQKAGAA
jgi:hypothetical protein